jgi:hypothetical protein
VLEDLAYLDTPCAAQKPKNSTNLAWHAADSGDNSGVAPDGGCEKVVGQVDAGMCPPPPRRIK